jgi:hypothetical protein
METNREDINIFKARLQPDVCCCTLNSKVVVRGLGFSGTTSYRRPQDENLNL